MAEHTNFPVQKTEFSADIMNLREAEVTSTSILTKVLI